MGPGVDATPQMPAFSILGILAGDKERRWYVGTHVSLDAKNNVSSGGGTITFLGSRREADSILGTHGTGSHGAIRALLLWGGS